MSSLFMGSIIYNAAPVDEAVVRTTAVPVEHDAPAAVMDSAPDRNEVTTDPNPHLGMVNRTLASAWHAPEKTAPGWIGQVSDGTAANAIINEQVSSSGTAAGREASGQWGHGTMAYAEGIEPVADLIDGGKMTNNYFAVDKLEANQYATDQMSVPPGYDHSQQARDANAGKVVSRKAQQQSFYEAYLNQVQGS